VILAANTSFLAGQWTAGASATATTHLGRIVTRVRAYYLGEEAPVVGINIAAAVVAEGTSL